MAGTELARFNLNQYQTQILLKLEPRAAGTYQINMLVEGNSLLSSVFVESADPGATVEVKYYDTTTGSLVGERFDLEDAHPVITDATLPVTDRRLVSKIHNKPIMEAIVTGGSVTFGVYVTVVQSFATDLDAALQLDNQVADLDTDKGMPMMVYDEVAGKFFMLRGENGVIPVSFSEAGDAVHERFQGVSTPGIQQTLITTVVPPAKLRKIQKLIVTGRHPGTYKLSDGSAIIASGRIGPGNLVDQFVFEPRLEYAAGTTLTMTFTALSGTPASDIEAYFMASDLDV